jgi:hypothetical protein
MKRYATFLLTGLCLATVGPACRKASREGAPAPVPAQAAPAQDPRITKIWVTKDGVIQLDGKVVDLAAIAPALDQTAKREGVIFYGREAAREEPHPNAVQIIGLITTRSLPVRFSSKPDFSDAIGPGQ